MTPRQQIHLHLLRGMPPTPEMYEEVAYLKDKGFIYGDYRRSKGRDNYGEIITFGKVKAI